MPPLPLTPQTTGRLGTPVRARQEDVVCEWGGDSSALSQNDIQMGGFCRRAQRPSPAGFALIFSSFLHEMFRLFISLKGCRIVAEGSVVDLVNACGYTSSTAVRRREASAVYGAPFPNGVPDKPACWGVNQEEGKRTVRRGEHCSSALFNPLRSNTVYLHSSM